MLHFEYWNTNRHLQDGETRGKACGLLVPFREGMIRGFYLTPNHSEGEKHPIVIMLHGFPGNTNNHDLGEALRRCGFIVINPYAPGSWGSDGIYTIDGIIDAAVCVCDYAHSDAFCEATHGDPDNIILFGHSMGGLVAANVLKRLSWIRTGVLLTPYNVSWFYANDMEGGFLELIDSTYLLRTKYGEPCGTEDARNALIENIRSIWQEVDYSAFAPDLADRNLYFISAEYDKSAQSGRMIQPVWEELQKAGGGVRLWENFPTDHGFNDDRLLLCEAVCRWLCSLFN